MTSRSTIELRRSLLRSPAVHFVLAGALLFAADRWWTGTVVNDGHETIRFTSADVARLRREWTAVHGAPPAPQDEMAMVERAADEEILEREAMRLNLDRGDPLVRERLAKLGEFLDVSGGVETDAPSREREARAVGLDRSDPVIRRYLVHLMEIGLAGPALPPAESDVRDRWQSVAADLTTPPRLRLSQVYLGADTHGEALQSDAETLLARLRGEAIAPERATALGDPFALGTQVGPLTSPELARSFGSSFVAALESAPVGEWVGPLRSAYGLHLVWLHERLPAREPDFHSVRNQVAWDVVREQQAERLASALARLRQKYSIEVEGG